MGNEWKQYLQVPDEAKALTGLLVWAGKEGQTETVQAFIDAVDNADWDGALKASKDLEQFIETTDNLENVGKAFEVLGHVNNALEVGEAIQNGNYEYAAAKGVAVAVDQVASNYLTSLGPGGIALDYVTHQTGEYLSGLMDQYQQHQSTHTQGQADINSASVGAWTYMRDWVEHEVEAKLQAGASPDEVSDWATQHMESHGAIYRDLEQMEGLDGTEQYARQVRDQDWIVQRTYDIWEHLDADDRGPLRSPDNDDLSSFNASDEYEVALLDESDPTTEHEFIIEATVESDPTVDTAHNHDADYDVSAASQAASSETVVDAFVDDIDGGDHDDPSNDFDDQGNLDIDADYSDVAVA